MFCTVVAALHLVQRNVCRCVRVTDVAVAAEIAECFGSCAKVFGEHFLPGYAQELHTFMQRLLGSRRAHERKIAFCVLDDVMEFCGPQFISIMLGLLSLYIGGIQDPSAEVRQAVVYGIGVCAVRMQQQLDGVLPELLTRLNAMITAADARSDENVFATENAIAAFGRLVQHHWGAMDAAAMLRTWLSYLPVLEDTEEGPLTYGMLCHFLETCVTWRVEFAFVFFVAFPVWLPSVCCVPFAHISGAGKRRRPSVPIGRICPRFCKRSARRWALLS